MVLGLAASEAGTSGITGQTVERTGIASVCGYVGEGSRQTRRVTKFVSPQIEVNEAVDANINA